MEKGKKCSLQVSGDSAKNFTTGKTFTLEYRPTSRSKKVPRKNSRKPLITTNSGSKCGRCASSRCCTYITQAVDTPRSKVDHEHLLWQVSHEHVKIYKDKDGWYLLVESKCSHLQDNGACGIYDVRPQVCRDYSNDYCEYDAPAEKDFLLYFQDYASFLRHCKKRFKRWSRG